MKRVVLFVLPCLLLHSHFVNALEFTSNGKTFTVEPVEDQYIVGMQANALTSKTELLNLQSVDTVRSLDNNSYIVTIDFETAIQAKSANGTLNPQAVLQTSVGVDFVYPVYRFAGSGTMVYPKPEVVVKIQPSTNIFSLAQRYGLFIVRPLLYTENQFVLRIPGNLNPFEMSETLNQDKDIVWANPNLIRVREKRYRPNDPLYSNQWHLNNEGQFGGTPGADISAEAAWDLHRARPDVVIAVIDDAIDTSHPDLNIYVNQAEADGLPNVDDDGNGLVDDINGWDFAGNDNDPSPGHPEDAHGTSVSGVAAAIGDNNLGVVGAAFGATILPVRIAIGMEEPENPDTDMLSEDAGIADALRYAARYADVINNSWGGSELSDVVAEALSDAASSSNGKRGSLGTPVLFASGNSATWFMTFESDDLFPPGQYTFNFIYDKDGSGTGGEDAVWIEQVYLIDGETFDPLFDAIDMPYDTAFPDGVSGGGDVPFSIVESSLTESGYVYRSGAIGDNQNSELTWTVDIPAESFLSVNFRTSTETDKDVFKILVDGEELFGVAYVQNSQDPLEEPAEYFDFPFSGEFQDNLYPMQGENLHPDVINIGASNDLDVRSTYSQWGQALHFLAPSDGGFQGIMTTDVTGTDRGYDPESDYTETFESLFGGTSSACPLAAGVLAMVISANPSLSKDEIIDILKDTSVKIGDVPYDSNGFNEQYGYGRLDMAAAVQRAIDSAPVGVNEWALY